MPYIKRENRAALDPIIDGLTKRLRFIDAKKGDVNYCITRIVAEVLNKDSYSSLSDCAAVLRDAATEIERRLIGPYEDACIRRNGDLQCLQSLSSGVPCVEPSPLPRPVGHDCCSTSEIGGCEGDCGDACKCHTIGCGDECGDGITSKPINEALTDQQVYTIDEERKERFRQLKEHSDPLKKEAP